MRKAGFIAVLLLMATPAFAKGWTCRNNDLEVTCTSEKCATPEGHTPISVNVKDDGFMNICAYSGCWEGKGKIFKSGNHVLISGQKLSWSGTAHGRGDFMIAFDRNNGIAVINGEGFAMPLLCQAQE